jgi:hypothetical protein
LNFSAGRLNVNDQSQLVLLTPDGQKIGDFELSPNPSPVLSANRALFVAGTTRIDPGATMHLAGGAFAGGALLIRDGAELRTTFAANTATAAVVAMAGSVIDATGGNLSIGDPAKVNGFGSAGTLHVGRSDVTLHDANDAVFDSLALVTLGAGDQPGELQAANGLTLNFGGNITGFGAIMTPNSAAAPLTNNGHIAGNSLAEPITLAGYVRGVGTLDNVVITGTDAPGFSPATVVRGSVAYDGALEIEIGGAAPGSFDRIEHLLGAGVADLGGALDVSLLGGFEPEVGQFIPFIYAMGGVFNSFDAVNLPTLVGGKALQLVYGETIVGVEVVPTFTADFDGDGDVDDHDLAVWEAAFGLNDLADADADGDSDGHDFLAWQQQYASGLQPLAVSHAAPEPASLTQLTIALNLLACRLLKKPMGP